MATEKKEVPYEEKIKNEFDDIQETFKNDSEKVYDQESYLMNLILNSRLLEECSDDRHFNCIRTQYRRMDCAANIMRLSFEKLQNKKTSSSPL